MSADPGTCRSCRAPIVWVRTRSGKPMPLDPTVITIVTDEGDTIRGRISHFGTCPNAAAHRKPNPKTLTKAEIDAATEGLEPYGCDVDGCHEAAANPFSNDHLCEKHGGGP